MKEQLRALYSSDRFWPLVVAFLVLSLHMVATAIGGYGYFRDELYYFACSEHLDAGYVDHPPFSIFTLALWRMLAGDSLIALRLFPALLAAWLVYLTSRIAREIGGGRTAQAAAAAGMACAPIVNGYASIYSMNAIELCIWALAFLLIVRMTKREKPTDWYLLGLLTGIGLLNKISMLWFLLGIAVGLLLPAHRHWLKRKEPYLAAVIALAIFSPFIAWNAVHGFPHLEFIGNASGIKYATQNPLTFLSGQLLLQNPFSLPLWLGGLVFLFLTGDLRPYRPLAVIFLTVTAVLIINGHSKPEYLAAAFPPLYAGGGLLLERLSARRFARWALRGYLLLVVVSGIAIAPFATPILPPESFIAYQKSIGIGPPSVEGHRMGPLPQFYADMFGWKEKALAVARVYNALPSEERSRCAIYADNYGRCGAIDFFGEAYGLPKSIGRHNNYWIWGPRGHSGELMIILGGDLEDKQERFESVEVVATVSSPYCMPYENDLRIYVCRKLRTPLKELWQELKVFI